MIRERSTSGTDSDILFRAAERFKPDGKISRIGEFGNGNVNKTFRVRLESASKGCFILQRLNRRIFLRPGLLMRNLRVLTNHLSRRLEALPATPGRRRWETPLILPSRDGEDQWIAPDGSFWRAMTFIEDAVSFDTVHNQAHAREVGYALGTFHSLLSDLPAHKLGDTLEGFHVTPLYLAHYDRVIAGAASGGAPRADSTQARTAVMRRTPAGTAGMDALKHDKSAETGAASRSAILREEGADHAYLPRPGTSAVPVRYCMEFIEKRRAYASVLENARTSGKLFLRPIHGDPKSNNIMMDIHTRQAVAFVDLDTVKPGLVQYDVGDCLRSCCNPLGEESEDWEAVRFETDYCGEILRGYLSIAEGFLTPLDREFFFDAARLIAFELGLRFFTDYLEGNVYFKVRGQEQNLNRALVQFRLAESIESQERAIRALAREKP